MDRQKFALHKSDSAPFILLLLINAFIYVPSALYTPFLNAYYKMNGLSATQIGILSTISPVCFILIQPMITRLSDRLGKPKAFSMAGVAGIILSLASYYLGNSFLSFFISATLLAIFLSPVYPLTDSMVIRNAFKKNYNYAYIRLGGTIGFSIAVLLVSFILSQHQELLFFMGMAGYAVLFILLAFLPKSENQRPPIETAKASRKVFSISELFTSNEVIFVLLFAFIFQIGASFLYAFLNVYITELGYDARAIGILQCVSSLSEAPILLCVRKVEKKFQPIYIIAVATILLSLRLFLVAGGTLVFFFFVQAMNGMTYMFVHFCTATYVANHVRLERASEGQGMIYLVQMGFAAIISTLFGGVLVDAVGFRAAYTIVGVFTMVAALAITLALVFYRRKHAE